MCSELGWTPDSARLEAMRAANEKEAARLDAAVKDAEENLGDIEVRDAHLAKAEYLYKIGTPPCYPSVTACTGASFAVGPRLHGWRAGRVLMPQAETYHSESQ